MQFIETSDLGVRSAVYRLRHPDASLQFLLFPMLHLGSPEYYAEVGRQLHACDFIIVEGVPSRNVRLLTWSYRIAERVRGSGLVSQAALDLRPFRAKLVYADMTAGEFDAGWASVPLLQRLLLFAGVPVAVLGLCLTGTKRALARCVETNDLPSREEVLWGSGPFEQSNELILHGRDVKLLRAIEDIHNQYRSEQRVVGVLWGAGHTRSVARLLLDKLQYRVARADWVTVFEF